ncbi:MAG: virulence RhuM family protein, partial [bacterium]|nr:virulence RhuM family protein [bacterium]
VRYENGEITIDVNVSPTEDTVWLNQNEIARLYKTTRENITMHINNIYEENELEINRTCKDSLQVQIEGKRKIERMIKYYNLDMIISIGYRVNTKRGIEFRRWATNVLKDYLLNGYSINEKRCLECSENIKSLNNKVDYLLTKDIDKDNRIQDLEKESNNYKDILFGKNYEYIEKGDIPTSIITFNRITKISKNNIKIVDKYIDSDVIDFLKAYTSTKFILFTSNNKLKDLTIPENISIRYGSTLHSRYIFVDDKYSYLLTCSMNTIGKNDYEIEFLDGLDPFDILKKL